MSCEAVKLTITGVVQGVGFRPFVYREACSHQVTGWVLNTVEGVIVHAEGESDNIDAFILALSEQAPAAAQVKKITIKEVPLEGHDHFEIHFSEDEEPRTTTLVSPDLATCDACVGELFDPANRRYHYPFINCTNCGPRFTIMRGLPYDRAQTSMAPFTMCKDCEQEYHDPADRRFHAQPDACFVCGPHLGWALSDLKTPLTQDDLSWAYDRQTSDSFIAEAAQLLREGKIVAVKGLGGYHLACDAQNPSTIATLRQRKRREGKAFAVMVSSVEEAKQYCFVSEAEEYQLTQPSRPIVLLQKRPEVSFACGLADALPELGIMLPSTPVQHLLLHEFKGMLVMTSGNIHDEPIVTDEEHAFSQLGTVADAFLVNDRAIEGRYDDSVLRVLNAGQAGEIVQFIRRARGFAPLPLGIPSPDSAEDSCSDTLNDTSIADQQQERDTVQVDKRSEETASGELMPEELLAVGPEQKNTFTYVRANQAFVSQHIGDMESVPVMDAWQETRSRYEQLFRLKPQRVVCDYHPEYLTSKWAHQQKLPVTQVQHHHAHILSVMGENELEGPVCGFAFDGTGYGLDEKIWGGEVLLSNLSAFERFANFAYIPLPGGAAAIKNPARIAYGALWAFDLLDHPAAQAFIKSSLSEVDILERMIEQGINSPQTSSVGRLFDAASALLGICTQPHYEGEAAILLEASLYPYLFREAQSAPSSDAAESTVKTNEAQANELAAGQKNESYAEKNSCAESFAKQLNFDSQELKQHAEAYRIELVKNVATKQSSAEDTSVLLLDAAGLFKALLDDIQAGLPTGFIAQCFHDAFVRVLVEMAELVRAVYGISIVALGGGVFMNRYLTEQALIQLQERGFTVAMNKDLPPNDASISYGQAVLGWQAQNKE